MKEELEKVLSFGDKLKLAREKKNLSTRDVADYIKTTEKNILNIEQNKVDFVPLVFFKNYVRIYAKLVDISPDEVETYLSTIKTKSKKEINYFLTEKTNKKSKKIWWLLMLIVLIIVGFISGFDYYKKQQAIERVEIGYYIAEPPASLFDS